MKKIYKIDIDCANCANMLETAAKRIDGVEDAAVNFMSQKLHIEFKDGASPDEIMAELRKVCKKIDRSGEIYI